MVIATAALADIAFTVYILCLAQNYIWLSLAIGSLIPFVNFIGNCLFVEAKTTAERLRICTATSIGMFIGSFVALLIFGKISP